MASADNASLEAGQSRDPMASWPGSAVLSDPKELAETAYLLRKERDLWIAHFEQLLQSSTLNQVTLADFQRAASRISEQAAAESSRSSLAVQPLNIQPKQEQPQKKDSLELDAEDENYVLSNPTQELIEERARNAVLQGDLRAANLHNTIVNSKVDSMHERLVAQVIVSDSEEGPESFIIRKLNAIEEAFMQRQTELEILKKGLETATNSLQRDQETLSTQRSLGESLETRVLELDTKLADALKKLDQTTGERDELKAKLANEQQGHLSNISKVQSLTIALEELQDQLKQASQTASLLKSKETELEEAKLTVKLHIDQDEKTRAEIESLNQQKAALEAKLAQLKQAGSELDQANTAFQDSVTALKAEMEALRTQSLSKAEDSAKLTETLQAELSTAQDALKKERERSEKLESELAATGNQNQTLGEKVGVLETERDQLKMKCDGLQEDLVAIRDGAAKMKAEYERSVKDLQFQLDNRSSECQNQMEVPNPNLGPENANLGLKALEEQLEAMKAESHALRAQLQTANSECSQLTAALASKQTELEAAVLQYQQTQDKQDTKRATAEAAESVGGAQASASGTQLEEAASNKPETDPAGRVGAEQSGSSTAKDGAAETSAEVERLLLERQQLQDQLSASQAQVDLLEKMLDTQKAESDAAHAAVQTQLETVKAEAAESVGKLFARVVELEEAKKQLVRASSPNLDETEGLKPEEGEAATKNPVSKLENKLSFDNMTFDKHSPDMRSIPSSKFISVDNLAHRLDQSFGHAAFEEDQDQPQKLKGLTLRDAVDKIDFLKGEVTRLHEVIKNLEDKIAAIQLQHSSIEYGYKHEIVGLKANFSSLQEELRQSRVDKSQLLLTLSRIENPTKDLETKKITKLQKEIESLRNQLQKAQSEPKKAEESHPELDKEVEKLTDQLEVSKTRIRRIQGALQLEAISYTRILDSMRHVLQNAKQVGSKLLSGNQDSTRHLSSTPIENSAQVPDNPTKLQHSQITFSDNQQDVPEEAASQKLCQCREELELIAAELGSTLQDWINLPSEITKPNNPEELSALKTSNSRLEQDLQSLNKELDQVRSELNAALTSKPEIAEDTSTAASLAEELTRVNIELAALRNTNADNCHEAAKFKAAAEELDGRLKIVVGELEALKDFQKKTVDLQAQLAILKAQEARWAIEKTELQTRRSEAELQLQELTTKLGTALKGQKQLQDENLSLQNKISSLEQARKGSEEWNKLESLAKQEDWNKQKTQLTSKIVDLETALADATTKHADKLVEIDRIQDSRLKDLQLSHDQEISLIRREFEQKLAASTQEVDQQPIKLSTTQWESLNGNLKVLEDSVKQVTKELESSRSLVAKLKEDLQSEKQASAKQIAELQALVEQQQMASSQKEALEAELTAEKGLNQSLQREISLLRSTAEQKPTIKDPEEALEVQARIKQLTSQLASAEAALAAAKKELSDREKILQQEVANKLSASTQQHRAQVETLSLQHQQELQALEARHRTDLQQATAGFRRDLEAEVSKHAAEVARLHKEAQQTVEQIKIRASSDADAAKVKADKEKMLMKKQFADDLERTEQLCSRLEATVREKERTIIELKASLQKSQEVSVSDLGKLTATPEELPIIEYLRMRVKAKDKLIDSIIKEVIAFEDILANDPDKDAPVEIALGILADLKKNMLDQSLEDNRAINSQMEAAVISVGKNSRVNHQPTKRLESRENSKRLLEKPDLDAIQEEDDTRDRPESERANEPPSFGFRQDHDQADLRAGSEPRTPERGPQTPSDSRNKSPERTIKQLKDEIALLNQKIASMRSQRVRDRSRDSVEEERTSKPVAMQRSGARNHANGEFRLSTPNGAYPTTPTQNKYQQLQPIKQATKANTSANDELEQKLVRLKADLVKGQEKMKLALIRLEEKDQLIEESAAEIQKLKRTLREMKISEKMMLKEFSQDQKSGSPKSTSKSNSMTPNRSPSGAHLAQKSGFLLPSGSSSRLPGPRDPSTTTPLGSRHTNTRSPTPGRPIDQQGVRISSRPKDTAAVGSSPGPRRPANVSSVGVLPVVVNKVNKGTSTEDAAVLGDVAGYLTLSAPQARDSAPLALYAAYDGLKGIHLRLVELTSRNSPDQLKTFSIEGQPALRLLRDLSRKILDILGVEKELKESESKALPSNTSNENLKGVQPKPNPHQEIVATLEELSRLASTTEELSGLYSQLDECAVLLAKTLTAKQKVASLPKIKDFIKASECDRFKFRCELLVKEEKKARIDKLRPLLKQTMDSVKQQYDLVRNTLNDRRSKLTTIAQGAGESLETILQSLPTK